jgi:hypothetical protein
MRRLVFLALLFLVPISVAAQATPEATPAYPPGAEGLMESVARYFYLTACARSSPRCCLA